MQIPSAFRGLDRRCAIYTRKSSDLGLDQHFNTLEAQRSICASYVASQKPNGWVEMPKRYDDGGCSGGTLVRPALQELLADIEGGCVDVVVVYKLDRITRSLLDFIRLLDLFQQYGVGFVAVTQNFDSSDSTGRLILNILLTFAQFEREIVSDRLKDKFSAMKKRGMFIGGHPPYGYGLKDKKLVIVSEEAAIVRFIFQRYLEVKGMATISNELHQQGVVRLSRVSKRGNFIKGRPISTSSVLNMLSNPIYVGDVRNKGQTFPGLHEPIVSRELWDSVQKLRAKRTRAKVVELYKEDLLRDLMVDCYGRKMGVFRDYRHQTRRRYYLSNQSEWGRRQGVRRFRVRADELDELVLAAIGSFLSDRQRTRSMLLRLGVHDGRLNKWPAAGAALSKWIDTAPVRHKQCVLKSLIERIELSSAQVKIIIRVPELPRLLQWDRVGLFRGDTDAWQRYHQTEVIDVPATTVCMKRELTLLLKRRSHQTLSKPNLRMVGLLNKARDAQTVLDGREAGNLHELSERIHCHPKRFTKLVRLNYLAPDIIAAIRDGAQPADLSCEKLMSVDLPMDWSLQRRLLGFPAQPDYLRAAPGW